MSKAKLIILPKNSHPGSVRLFAVIRRPLVRCLVHSYSLRSYWGCSQALHFLDRLSGRRLRSKSSELHWAGRFWHTRCFRYGSAGRVRPARLLPMRARDRGADRLHRPWLSNPKDVGRVRVASQRNWRVRSVDLAAETLTFDRAPPTGEARGKRRFTLIGLRRGNRPPGFAVGRKRIYDECGRLTGGPQDASGSGR